MSDSTTVTHESDTDNRGSLDSDDVSAPHASWQSSMHIPTRFQASRAVRVTPVVLHYLLRQAGLEVHLASETADSGSDLEPSLSSLSGASWANSAGVRKHYANSSLHAVRVGTDDNSLEFCDGGGPRKRETNFQKSTILLPNGKQDGVPEITVCSSGSTRSFPRRVSHGCPAYEGICYSQIPAGAVSLATSRALFTISLRFVGRCRYR